MKHEHTPEPGAVRASRCTICRKVIVRRLGGPWRIKPKGHS